MREETRPVRGDGSIFKRSDVYWLSYSRDGKRFKRSARTSDPDAAEKKLQQLRKDVERGDALTSRQRRATVRELLQDLVTDLELRERAYAEKVPYHLKPLLAELGDVRAGACRLQQAMIIEAHRRPRAPVGRPWLRPRARTSAPRLGACAASSPRTRRP